MRLPQAVVPVCAALTFCLISTPRLPAQPSPVSAADSARYAQQFDAVQRDTRTFRADLRQILQLEGVSKPIVSSGTLSFQAPRQMLIRYSLPTGEWMLINGMHVAIKKQNQPLQVRDVADGKTNSQAASLLDFFHSDASHWNRDFQVTMTRDGDLLQVHLKPYLTPTAPSQGVDEIVTTLHLPGFQIAGIELQINAANRIEYQFIHAERNVPLDPALFQLPAWR